MREETICNFSRKSGKVCSVCDVRTVRQCGPSWGGVIVYFCCGCCSALPVFVFVDRQSCDLCPMLSQLSVTHHGHYADDVDHWVLRAHPHLIFVNLQHAVLKPETCFWARVRRYYSFTHFFTWIFKIFYLGNKKLSQLILKLLSAAPTFTMGSPQQVSLHIFKCQKLFQLSC